MPVLVGALTLGVSTDGIAGIVGTTGTPGVDRFTIRGVVLLILGVPTMIHSGVEIHGTQTHGIQIRGIPIGEHRVCTINIISMATIGTETETTPAELFLEAPAMVGTIPERALHLEVALTITLRECRVVSVRVLALHRDKE